MRAWFLLSFRLFLGEKSTRFLHRITAGVNFSPYLQNIYQWEPPLCVNIENRKTPRRRTITSIFLSINSSFALSASDIEDGSMIYDASHHTRMGTVEDDSDSIEKRIGRFIFVLLLVCTLARSTSWTKIVEKGGSKKVNLHKFKYSQKRLTDEGMVLFFFFFFAFIHFLQTWERCILLVSVTRDWLLRTYIRPWFYLINFPPRHGCAWERLLLVPRCANKMRAHKSK